MKAEKYETSRATKISCPSPPERRNPIKIAISERLQGVLRRRRSVSRRVESLRSLSSMLIGLGTYIFFHCFRSFIISFSFFGAARHELFQNVFKNVYVLVFSKNQVGRFINHSCEPNLLKSFVYTSIQDPRAPRIAFFAARDIEPMTELTYDYAYGTVEGKSLKCYCGAKKCRGFLY